MYLMCLTLAHKIFKAVFNPQSSNHGVFPISPAFTPSWPRLCTSLPELDAHSILFHQTIPSSPCFVLSCPYLFGRPHHPEASLPMTVPYRCTWTVCLCFALVGKSQMRLTITPQPCTWNTLASPISKTSVPCSLLLLQCQLMLLLYTVH